MGYSVSKIFGCESLGDVLNGFITKSVVFVCLSHH